MESTASANCNSPISRSTLDCVGRLLLLTHFPCWVETSASCLATKPALGARRRRTLRPRSLPRRLPPPPRQAVERGEARLGAERLLDAQDLVPFRHALRARE